MISRNTTNPMHWDATPSMLPELLPHFVDYVAEQGGKYIITKDGSIPVDDAMKQKKLVDRYALEARMHYSLSEDASGLGDMWHHKMNMEQAAYHAGVCFCLYVRVLGHNANPKATPLISDIPILEEFWGRGFKDIEGQLSRPSEF